MPGFNPAAVQLKSTGAGAKKLPPGAVPMGGMLPTGFDPSKVQLKKAAPANTAAPSAGPAMPMFDPSQVKLKKTNKDNEKQEN